MKYRIVYAWSTQWASGESETTIEAATLEDVYAKFWNDATFDRAHALYIEILLMQEIKP